MSAKMPAHAVSNLAEELSNSGPETVMLLGLARRTARKPRKHHHFTEGSDVREAVKLHRTEVGIPAVSESVEKRAMLRHARRHRQSSRDVELRRPLEAVERRRPRVSKTNASLDRLPRTCLAGPLDLRGRDEELADPIGCQVGEQPRVRRVARRVPGAEERREYLVTIERDEVLRKMMLFGLARDAKRQIEKRSTIGPPHRASGPSQTNPARRCGRRR